MTSLAHATNFDKGEAGAGEKTGETASRKIFDEPPVPGGEGGIMNPNALYLVVSEWLKLTGNVNLRKFKVNQIYVLRKQKNTDREYRFLPDYEKNPIHLDVVEHLFNTVRTHLTSNWEGGIAYGLERGYLL